MQREVMDAERVRTVRLRNPEAAPRGFCKRRFLPASPNQTFWKGQTGMAIQESIVVKLRGHEVTA